ncbi:hypothetical protein [Polyangium mundeleinium]|uniref:HEPN domain-containing protein n=1 Tax=Polyangium mundeleinium TaxID=2995306 RepID=A0ABT5EK87_9BACT|nr:hypothetical protein [Polyangium mundeleinium]MDC0742204.1 hypothetical protein [Polyangium mundeleinium]
MAKPRVLTISEKATALASAALRHVRDAEHLLGCSEGYSSPDQAYHLAGFGPECARKATIAERWLDQAIGHGTTERTDELLAFAASIDPVAHRYEILELRARCPELVKWTVDVRYERTSTRSAEQAEKACEEAREIVDAIVLAMWADGRLDDGEVLW